MAAEPSPSEFQPYRKVQGAAEQELRGVLERTARAIRKRVASLPLGIGGQVRAAQLRTTLAAISRLQRAMWTADINPAVARAIKDAEEAAESAIEAMTRVAYAALPDAAAESLVRGLRASAESGLKSDAARRKRELSERVYRQRALHDGKIEDLIREGLVASLSAKELASTVYQYVSPTTPGGASYAAMRLARTEINNAFHERQIQGATRPGVSAVKWNLSGSHKVPDECNVYAAHKPFDPDKVPEKPHPQCFCYLTYVTMPSEDFQAKLAAGGFDDEIERRTRANLARLGQKVGNIEPGPQTSSVASLSPAAYDDRVSRARRDEDALAAAPFGLDRRPRPKAFTGNMASNINKYTGSAYKGVNGKLRGQNLSIYATGIEDNEIPPIIKGIDAAMKRSSLTADAILYRGVVNARTMFGDDLDYDLTGMEWQEDAYTSTTALERRTRGFLAGGKDKMLMTILTPAGTPAIEASGKDLEAEMLIARGTKFRVVRDNGIDSSGVRRVDVEVSGVR